MRTTMATENNNKTLNVPNLRFPEFREEWEKFRNDSLFNVVSEKNKGKQITSVLSASQTDGMVSRDSLGIDIKFEEDSIKNYKIVREGDYVIHLRSFQGGFAFSDRVGVCSPAYTILRPTQQISYGFFKPFFMSNKFIDSLRLVTYGIRDGKSISVEEWLKLNTNIPSVEEQKKISIFLSLLDDRIATQIKIIEDLKKLKSAISNKYLYDKSWPKYKISEIATLGRGRVISSKEIGLQRNPIYPVYSSQTSNDGVMGYLDTYDFDGEYITWTTDGANAGTVFYRNGQFNCTNVCGTIKVGESFDAYFLSTILQTATARYVSINLANPKLMNNTMASIVVRIPDIKIQKYWSSILRKMEEKLSVEATILLALQQQKQYLLAQMFI